MAIALSYRDFAQSYIGGSVSEQVTNGDSLQDLASKLISVTEAARISGLTTGHLRKLLREGQIEGVKIGTLSWLAF